ncbi:ABC transporter ATP-binding protein [Comamonas serinivorans]|uniref:ABC transporter ATP-binding protein n=1 Tax=Comamonas serinivorans TaxID=1082851 RepID=A0A1Y0EP58_9BURK|nr:ABC transporter ATP-binding protein [Comamonas serinivorans]ARU05220.1 ABC transporter ATP-binding protein [Comamonas serinivorans]
MTNAPAPMLQVNALAKRHGDTPVFEQVSFETQRGEFLALMGESGVGKSSLLNCLAGLDTWQDGTVTVAGQDLAQLNDTQRAHWRRHAVGFVFQAFHVLPHLDVAQNVRLPLLLVHEAAKGRGTPGSAPELSARAMDERVQAALDGVGLGALGHRLPRELSGGQLQRVAIARALVHRPPLVLADEPTGNLDPDTAATVLQTLVQQVRATGATLVMVTHADSAAQRADRVLRLTAHGVVAQPPFAAQR